MNITRIGKIARLPKRLRDELGGRLEDGEPGKDLVKWLNTQPVVLEILREHFGGRPITQQNLSEWRAGGHQDWLRHEADRQQVSRLTEEAEALNEAADGQITSDNLADVLAVELTRLARMLLEKETDPEKRWQRLCEIHRELSRLRRDDHRAVHTGIKREAWARQVYAEDQAAEELEDKQDRARRAAPYWAMLKVPGLAKIFGGSESAQRIAEYLTELQDGLEPGRLGPDYFKNVREAGRKTKPNPTPADPAEPPAKPAQSDPIQPDQTIKTEKTNRRAKPRQRRATVPTEPTADQPCGSPTPE